MSLMVYAPKLSLMQTLREMWSENLKSIASKCQKNYNIPIFTHLHFFMTETSLLWKNSSILEWLKDLFHKNDKYDGTIIFFFIFMFVNEQVNNFLLVIDVRERLLSIRYLHFS